MPLKLLRGEEQLAVSTAQDLRSALAEGYKPADEWVTIADKSGRPFRAKAEELDHYLSIGASPVGIATSEANTQQKLLEQEYGDPIEGVRAFGEGGLSTLSFGLTDYAFGEGAARRREFHPGARLAGEITGGVVAGAAAGPGGVAGGVAKTPGGAIVRAGEKASRALGGGGKGWAAAGAIEGLGFSAAQINSQVALSDDPLTTEQVASHLTLGAALGGVFGGALGWRRARLERQALEHIDPALQGRTYRPIGDNLQRNMDDMDRVAREAYEARPTAEYTSPLSDRTEVDLGAWHSLDRTGAEDVVPDLGGKATVPGKQAAGGPTVEGGVPASEAPTPAMGVPRDPDATAVNPAYEAATKPNRAVQEGATVPGTAAYEAETAGSRVVDEAFTEGAGATGATGTVGTGTAGPTVDLADDVVVADSFLKQRMGGDRVWSFGQKLVHAADDGLPVSPELQAAFQRLDAVHKQFDDFGALVKGKKARKIHAEGFDDTAWRAGARPRKDGSRARETFLDERYQAQLAERVRRDPEAVERLLSEYEDAAREVMEEARKLGYTKHQSGVPAQADIGGGFSNKQFAGLEQPKLEAALYTLEKEAGPGLEDLVSRRGNFGAAQARRRAATAAEDVVEDTVAAKSVPKGTKPGKVDDKTYRDPNVPRGERPQQARVDDRTYRDPDVPRGTKRPRTPKAPAMEDTAAYQDSRQPAPPASVESAWLNYQKARRSLNKGLGQKIPVRPGGAPRYRMDVEKLVRSNPADALQQIMLVDDYYRAVQRLDAVLGDVGLSKKIPDVLGSIGAGLESRALGTLKRLRSLDDAELAALVGIPLEQLPVMGPVGDSLLRMYGASRMGEVIRARGVHGVLADQVARHGKGFASDKVAGRAMRALSWVTRNPVVRAADLAMSVAGNIARVEQGIAQFLARPITRRVATQGSTAILAKIRFGEKNNERTVVRQRIREIEQALANPGATEKQIDAALLPVRAASLQMGFNVGNKMRERLTHYAETAPKLRPENPLIKSHWEPSPQDVARWARIIRAGEDPLSLFDDLQSGRLSVEAVETVEKLWPETFRDIQQKLLTAVLEQKKPLPYEKRLALTVFFKLPVEPSAAPEFVFALQQLSQQQQDQQQAGGQAPTSGQLDADGILPQTKGQRLTER